MDSDDKVCPRCAETVKAAAVACRHCGHSFDTGATGSTLPLTQKYCSGCGTVIHKDAPACPSCGAPQIDARDRKSRGVAIILALFLGGFGAHKFYLGRVGWGVIYALFFWTFIPALAALVELIIYACMSEEAFHAKYG